MSWTRRRMSSRSRLGGSPGSRPRASASRSKADSPRRAAMRARRRAPTLPPATSRASTGWSPLPSGAATRTARSRYKRRPCGACAMHRERRAGRSLLPARSSGRGGRPAAPAARRPVSRERAAFEGGLRQCGRARTVFAAVSDRGREPGAEPGRPRRRCRRLHPRSQRRPDERRRARRSRRSRAAPRRRGRREGLAGPGACPRSRRSRLAAPGAELRR